MQVELWQVLSTTIGIFLFIASAVWYFWYID